MFDSYTTRQVTESVTKNVNVTENRAPTDESVRLLREMEQAVKDKFLKSISLNNNEVSGKFFLEQSMWGSNIYNFAIMINGKKHMVKFENKFENAFDNEKDKLISGLIKAVAEVIAVEALSSMHELNRHLK